REVRRGARETLARADGESAGTVRAHRPVIYFRQVVGADAGQRACRIADHDVDISMVWGFRTKLHGTKVSRPGNAPAVADGDHPAHVVREVIKFDGAAGRHDVRDHGHAANAVRGAVAAVECDQTVCSQNDAEATGDVSHDDRVTRDLRTGIGCDVS